MEKRHNYKKLSIWNMGIEIAVETLEIIKKLPTSEVNGLCSQMSRCSSSIPSNIAEGSSRTNKSFAHFIDIALGSSYELETQLIISKKRNYLPESDFKELEKKIDEFQKMTRGFKKSLLSV